MINDQCVGAVVPPLLPPATGCQVGLEGRPSGVGILVQLGLNPFGVRGAARGSTPASPLRPGLTSTSRALEPSLGPGPNAAGFHQVIQPSRLGEAHPQLCAAAFERRGPNWAWTPPARTGPAGRRPMSSPMVPGSTSGALRCLVLGRSDALGCYRLRLVLAGLHDGVGSRHPVMYAAL